MVMYNCQTRTLPGYVWVKDMHTPVCVVPDIGVHRKSISSIAIFMG